MGKPKRDRRARRAEVDKNDVYEAEELVPDEEKHAGQRYDNVESYEYELPAKFEDEEIDEDLAFTEEDKKKYGAWFGDEEQGDGAEASDKEDGLLQSDEEAEEEPNPDDYSEEEDIFGEAGADLGDAEVELDGQSDEEGAEEEDEAKHQAMLDAVRGKDVQRRKRREVVISEAYPESEYNLQPSVLSAGEAAAGELTIADLVGGLGDSKRKLGAARKTLEKLDKKAEPVAAPLPGPIRQRQERKAGYEATGKEVTKWQPVVKANREAPTIRFTSGREDIPKTNTTAAMASSFKPETDMEAEVAALLQAAGAHTGEAVEQQEEALALKSLTVEEAKERRARLAQMRTLLFFHEAKAKRMKAIKSKDYHRRTNRAAKRKAEKAGDTGDEDIIRLAAENAEFKRAQERLTLKHKNTSKWARRALKRGIDVMDEGTKAAVTEQLRLGEELRRKVDKADDGSESDSESDGGTSASEGEGEGKEPAGYAAAKKGRGMSAKAKAAALDLLQGGDAEAPAPTKGLFALPFMARAIQRQKAKAEEEAREMLKQIEREDAAAADCDAEADASDGDEDARPVRGRRMFGGSGAGQPAQAGASVSGSDLESDADEDAEAKAERLTLRLNGSLAPTSAPANRGAGGSQRSAQLGQQAGHGSAADGAQRQGNRGRKQRGSQAGDADNGAQQPMHVTMTDGPISVDMPSQRSNGGAADTSSGSESEEDLRRQGRGSRAAETGQASKPSVLMEVSRQRAAGKGHDWLFENKAGGAAAPAGAVQEAEQLGSDDDANAWRSAKVAVVSIGPAAAGVGAAAAGDGQPSTRPPAFIKARKFAGRKQGYAFKKGPQGVGYYLDRKSGRVPRVSQPPSHQAPAAEASQPAQNGSAGGQQQQKQPDSARDSGDEDNMQPLAGTELTQRQLISRAFAGDDVEAEFAAEKAAEVAEELPDIETPSVMPGWGAWAGQAREPRWMQDARTKAQKAKEKAAGNRKDAKLKAVMISERWDKKASKYSTASVPFPFDSRETYERSIRQPMGRDFNTDSAFRDFTRPAILKSTGVIIEPLKYSKPLADEDAKLSKLSNAKRAAMAVVAGGRLQQVKRRKTK